MFGAGREGRAVEAASATFLRGAERGLGIGKRLPALENLQLVSELAGVASLHGNFDAVLWRTDRSLRDGMAVLRPHLTPGARLFFVVELVPSVWGMTWQLLGGRQIARFTREGVCEELLLSGLMSPRVWVDAARFVGVSGQLPERLDALDQVFAQPWAG